MLTALLLAASLLQTPVESPVITGSLAAEMAKAGEARVPCYAVFRERPDFEKLGAELQLLRRGERGRALAAKMQQFDAEHHVPFVKKLESLLATGDVARILDLTMANAVAFEARPATIRALSREPGLLYIQFDASWPLDSLSDAPPPALPAAPPAAPASAPPSMIVASHLTQIRATDVWAKGFTGQNITIALIDLGTAYDHPNLASHIWTNPGEINNNGIDDDGDGLIDDYYGWNFNLNSKNVYNVGHGTMVAGLLVGDGTLVDGFGNQYKTGVAPGAKLMLCVNGANQSSYWGCQQYAIARGADLISSSQSYKWFLPLQPDFHMFRTMCDAELAAGILHINSAGNNGALLGSFPIPFNIGAPANCPQPWLHSAQVQAGRSSVLAVTAVNGDDSLFGPSSQGPSAWDNIKLYDANYGYTQYTKYWDYPYFGGNPGLLKPDVCAPNNVTTVDQNNIYSFGFTGTSAATPIVAGAAALVLSANPDLEPRHLAHLLQATAVDLGAVGKDTRFGAGRIDAYEAWRRGLVSIKTLPHEVQLDNYISFVIRTLPAEPTFALIALNNSQTIVPGYLTLDVSDPLDFLLYDFYSATPDYPPFGFTVPYDPLLAGYTFYLQLAVDDTAGTTGTWIPSAIDWFTILP
jgi:subtilisin family serine protease